MGERKEEREEGREEGRKAGHMDHNRMIRLRWRHCLFRTLLKEPTSQELNNLHMGGSPEYLLQLASRASRPLHRLQTHPLLLLLSLSLCYHKPLVQTTWNCQYSTILKFKNNNNLTWFQTPWFPLAVILAPKGHCQMPGGSFSCHSLGGATATWWLEARNAATQSTAAATAKRYWPRKSTVPQLRDPGSTQHGLQHALLPLGPCTHRSLCMWIICRVSRKMSFPWRPSLTLKSGVGVPWHIYVKPSPVIALITLHDNCFSDLPLTILRTATCVCH